MAVTHASSVATAHVHPGDFLTDGISEAYRARRIYDEWDAPHCIICVRKFDKKVLEQHIMTHSMADMVKGIQSWSLAMWKNDGKL